MISHEEAQALISARLDGPLDPAANRALLAHLATCPACRQFAEQANVLARGLRDLPHLPPSPTVSVITTKTRLPPSTAQFGVVFSATSRSCLRKRCRTTPRTDMTGMISAAV